MWRIIGIGSLVWGVIAFYILNTTPLPPSPEVSLPGSLELAIYFLSTGWLISSTLVKIGLTLNRRWIKLSVFSCICFIFMLLHMGLTQAYLANRMPTSEPPSSYPYNLVSTWFVSWFWIDLLTIAITWMERKFRERKI